MPLLLRENVKHLLVPETWNVWLPKEEPVAELQHVRAGGTKTSPSLLQPPGERPNNPQVPLAALLLWLSTPAPRTWDPTGAGFSYWPTSLLKWLHAKRCHCSFPKRMCLFFSSFFLLNKFPCHLFVFSNCSSFKAPCCCSFCLCIGYFWKLGNQEEGRNLGELTAVEVESSFPWYALSSLSFLLMTSVIRPPLHCSFQGKP